MIRIDITDGPKLQVVTREKIPEIVHTLTADSDAAHNDPIAGRDGPGLAERGGGNNIWRRNSS